MSALKITVQYGCKHYGLVPAGKDEGENATKVRMAVRHLCPMCQDKLNEHNEKARKAGRPVLKF